jgi:hypothetical protein
MAGLVPAIHALADQVKDVDARHKAGHDEFGQARQKREKGYWLEVTPVGRPATVISMPPP